jgi:hypothetical protein
VMFVGLLPLLRARTRSSGPVKVTEMRSGPDASEP